MKFLSVSYCSIIFLLLIQCKTEVKNEKVSDPEQQIESRLISVDKAKALAATGDYQFIDLRTPEEIVESGKIIGALELDFRSDSFKKDFNNLDKKKGYVLYCRSGGRSSDAFKTAISMGFENIYDLDGGFTAWSEINK